MPPKFSDIKLFDFIIDSTEWLIDLNNLSSLIGGICILEGIFLISYYLGKSLLIFKY